MLASNIGLREDGSVHSTVSFTVLKPASPESLGILRTDIADAVAAGSREIVIDVDDIGILDFPIITVLISILRQSRESGASVSLRAKRQSILDTLRITALNKVFTVISTDALPGRRVSVVAR
jgi:anti-sigma B factor antagonist